MKVKTLKTIVIITMIFLLTACSSTPLTEEEMRKLPISSIEASFVYNTHDPKEAVGISDYVFIGKVLSYDGVQYKHRVMIENVGTVGSPYTDYTVQVDENIKGKLNTNEPICIAKEGGVTQDGKEIYVFERDEMPETGKTYIFLGYAQPDGTIVVSGPESNILINDDKSIVDKYKEAYKNEIITDLSEHERFHSIYEE